MWMLPMLLPMLLLFAALAADAAPCACGMVVVSRACDRQCAGVMVNADDAALENALRAYDNANTNTNDVQLRQQSLQRIAGIMKLPAQPRAVVGRKGPAAVRQLKHDVRRRRKADIRLLRDALRNVGKEIKVVSKGLRQVNHKLAKHRVVGTTREVLMLDSLKRSVLGKLASLRSKRAAMRMQLSKLVNRFKKEFKKTKFAVKFVLKLAKATLEDAKLATRKAIAVSSKSGLLRASQYERRAQVAIVKLRHMQNTLTERSILMKFPDVSDILSMARRTMLFVKQLKRHLTKRFRISSAVVRPAAATPLNPYKARVKAVKGDFKRSAGKEKRLAKTIRRFIKFSQELMTNVVKSLGSDDDKRVKLLKTQLRQLLGKVNAHQVANIGKKIDSNGVQRRQASLRAMGDKQKVLQLSRAFTDIMLQVAKYKGLTSLVSAGQLIKKASKALSSHRSVVAVMKKAKKAAKKAKRSLRKLRDMKRYVRRISIGGKVPMLTHNFNLRLVNKLLDENIANAKLELQAAQNIEFQKALQSPKNQLLENKVSTITADAAAKLQQQKQSRNSAQNIKKRKAKRSFYRMKLLAALKRWDVAFRKVRSSIGRIALPKLQNIAKKGQSLLTKIVQLKTTKRGQLMVDPATGANSRIGAMVERVQNVLKSTLDVVRKEIAKRTKRGSVKSTTAPQMPTVTPIG